MLHCDHACILIQLEVKMIRSIIVKLFVWQIPIIQIIYINTTNFCVWCLTLQRRTIKTIKF